MSAYPQTPVSAVNLIRALRQLQHASCVLLARGCAPLSSHARSNSPAQTSYLQPPFATCQASESSSSCAPTSAAVPQVAFSFLSQSCGSWRAISTSQQRCSPGEGDAANSISASSINTGHSSSIHSYVSHNGSSNSNSQDADDGLSSAISPAASSKIRMGGGGWQRRRLADKSGLDKSSPANATVGTSPPQHPLPSSNSSPIAPPPRRAHSSPLQVKNFPQGGGFTLVLHHLPQQRSPRSPAQQRCLGAALGLVHRLRNHGYTGMFAGGWVRDQFLGRPSADIDLVTNATTVQIFEVFGARHCKLKGGSTCAVTWEGLSFEVTSYRGGLYDDCEEAEWRDAACRDFTINALFFSPNLASNHHLQQQQKQLEHNQQQPSLTALESPTATPSHVPVPQTRQQPSGEVKDYVGGVQDLRRGVLRVYKDHVMMGNTASSVEVDPLRVLRAARLSVELRMRVDPYTEERVRRAAAKCVLTQNGVSGSRVYRELAKMNDLDKHHSNTSSSAPGSSSDGGVNTVGGASSGGGGDGSRGGSPRFAEALSMCCEWRALEALLPRLPQEPLRRVLATVFPALPADLPMELKLACLAAMVVPPEGIPAAPGATAAATGGAAAGAGGKGRAKRDELMPCNVAERYEAITALLSEARQSQSNRHLPDLLRGLSDLLITDYSGTLRSEEWARWLAAEGADQVERAMAAFLPSPWQILLRKRLLQHRAMLAPLIEAHRARQRPAPGANGGMWDGGSVVQPASRNHH